MWVSLLPLSMLPLESRDTPVAFKVVVGALLESLISTTLVGLYMIVVVETVVFVEFSLGDFV